MIRIIRSEWVKLRRPAYSWVPYLLGIAFTVLITVLGISNAKTRPTIADHGGPPDRLVGEYEHAHGAVIGLHGAGVLLAIIAFVIFAAAISTEYQTGTIRNLLIREPRRVRLMLGRWLALCSWALVLAVICLVAGLISGEIAMSSRGLSTSAWLESDGIRHIGSTLVYVWLGIFLYGTFGAILGVLLRTPVAAIGIGLAYFLIVENIITGLAPGTLSWMPGGLIDSVANGGNDTRDFWPSLGIISGYIALAGGLTLAWFNRSDVTA